METAKKFLGVFNRTDNEDPLKAFNFLVEIDGFARFGFSRVSGLSSETEVITYRESGMNTTEQKSPGLTRFGPLTFERGQILAAGMGDSDTMSWYQQVFDSDSESGSSGTFRRTIDIVQLNKEKKPVIRWRVKNAWPSAHNPVGDFDAQQSANNIEVMTVQHEGYSYTRLV